MREIIYEELKVGDKVVTRDGREGRVICTDLKDADFPTVCALKNSCGTEFITHYKSNGKHISSSEDERIDCSLDIFLPPVKMYLNLYRRSDGFHCSLIPFSTREQAECCERLTDERIETIEVEV